jgi:ABC-type antimicrobial peptide transport system permease subunit
METLFLSIVGAPTGMLLGFLTISITSKTGIDLSIVGNGLESVGLSNLIYPVIEPKFYLFIGLIVFLFTLIAAIYPSKKALKLKPTEAIRNL